MSDIVLYTSAEVAELLKLNPQVVQRKLQAGEIPGYQIGREWRVERDQLLGWLEEHSNRRRRGSEAERAVAAWFGPDGRLTAIPTARSKRTPILRRLSADLEPDRTYT